MKKPVNYAEILRLHRKYKVRDGEPLWEVFVRMGQELEIKKTEVRCYTCHRLIPKDVSLRPVGSD